MSISDDQPVQFDGKTVRRIIAAVRWVEAQVRGSSASRRASPWTYSIVRARVTTAIPTGTFDVPSSSGRAQVVHPDASGAWVASGSPVVVWNDHTVTASVAANKAVKLAWIGGGWWLVAADC